MIVAERKPLEEIVSAVAGFGNVLVLGCGTCVTVCLTGGDREARALTRELEHATYPASNPEPPRFQVDTIERQCERDMVQTYLKVPPGTEAILSLACGAGVQTMADLFSDLPVLPALNTTFLGALDEPGLWREKCRGCGNCILTETAGLCPIARCAKRLLNGPCGGSRNGICEISPQVECVWHLIVQRLMARGKLAQEREIRRPKDWSTDRWPRWMEKPVPVPGQNGSAV